MARSRRFIMLWVLLVVLAAACSGNPGAGETGPSKEPVTASPSVATTISSVPASSTLYRYQNDGLVATLDIDDLTLEVDNQTGRELPKPDFYIISGDGQRRLEGKVVAAAPVPDGQSVTFDVQVPGAIAPDEIGLVVLLMGSDNYGAFVQQ